ncbi:MAG: hypothetical protein ACOYJ8_01215 [Patescibacteria group bacterium]|jgi:hypothetical protein
MRQGSIRARSTIRKGKRRDKEPSPENAGIAEFEALFYDLNNYGIPQKKWEEILGVVAELRDSLGWNIYVPRHKKKRSKCGNGKLCYRCRQAMEEINKIDLFPDIRLCCIQAIEKVKKITA